MSDNVDWGYVSSNENDSKDKYGTKRDLTYPISFLRRLLTTSFTPRLTKLFFDAFLTRETGINTSPREPK